jgi:colicin import membrane protein
MSPSSVNPAFNYDFGPALLQHVDAVGIPKDRRFFRIVFASTVFVHFLILLLNPRWFFSPPEINFEDVTTVDMEFAGDLSLKAPQENALPNAKESPEVAVPANLLPQLPKKFEVEEANKPEEKNFAEEKDPKVEDALAKKEIAPPEREEVPKTKDDPNKVTREDLLKRLAVEKLKRENKVDQQMKAQKNALAKLKEDLVAADAKTNSGASSVGVSAIRAKTYADLLRAAVKRNLYLPKTFEYDRAQLVTQLSVVINEKGELVEVKLARSSGNGAYDQAAIAALQNSVPLPQPPSEIVGQSITFNLSK